MKFARDLSASTLMTWMPFLKEEALCQLIQQCSRYGPWDDLYWTFTKTLSKDDIINLMITFMQEQQCPLHESHLPLDTLHHEDACRILQSTVYAWNNTMLKYVNTEDVDASFYDIFRFKGSNRLLSTFPARVRYAFLEYHLDWCYTLEEREFMNLVEGLPEAIQDWYRHVGYKTIHLDYIERHAPNLLNLELWKLWKNNHIPQEQYYHVIHVLAECIDVYTWEQDNDVQPIILHIPY